MARSKGSSKKKSVGGKGPYRSAISGRYVTAKHGRSNPKTTVKESNAAKFAHGYIRENPDTFHELSKR